MTAGWVPAGRGGSRDSAGRAEAPSHGTERRGQAERDAMGRRRERGRVICGTGPLPPAAPAAPGAQAPPRAGRTDGQSGEGPLPSSGPCGAEPPVCW